MVAHRHRHTIANEYLISFEAEGNEKVFSRVYFNKIFFMKNPRGIAREKKNKKERKNKMLILQIFKWTFLLMLLMIYGVKALLLILILLSYL